MEMTEKLFWNAQLIFLYIKSIQHMQAYIIKVFIEIGLNYRYCY